MYLVDHTKRGALVERYAPIPMNPDGDYLMLDTGHKLAHIGEETRFGDKASKFIVSKSVAENAKVFVVRDLKTLRGGETFGVLNHGFVEYQDHMGSDEDIAAAAHTSYTGQKRKGTDEALLRYLWRNRHTTPFEMAQLKIRIYIPIFVYRQLFRHRTASQLEMDGDMISNDTAFSTYSVQNEMSGRYVDMPNHYHLPEPYAVQPQSKTNKQGREESGYSREDQLQAIHDMTVQQESARALYDLHIKNGMAFEMARTYLPLAQYTLLTWRIDLKNLLHFLSLRLHAHAQFEVRQYALAIYEIVKVLWPESADAFEEYTRGAVTFSATEYSVLRSKLELTRSDDMYDMFCSLVKNKRERAEFAAKIDYCVT